MSKLEEHVAAAISAETAALASRWRTQSLAVAPRASASNEPLDGAGDEDDSHGEGSSALEVASGERIVSAIACDLRGEPACQDALMRTGWELGVATHADGTSLHSLLKEIHLLEAMLLYAAERAVGESPEPATAADGVAVVRRLNRAVSLVSLSATKGFTHAYLQTLQAHYRKLRHDIRNPLGTIKSAIALMEDPSVSADMRNDPRYRAMVARNAKTIDGMIGRELSDASALGPAFARHEVSLRDLALAVRRDLRAAAADAECAIEVDDEMPVLCTDSTSFELALRSVVLALMSVAARPAAVHVGPVEMKRSTFAVSVILEPPPVTDLASSDTLGFARELATRAGGRLTSAGALVCLELPASASHAGHDVARAG